MHTQPQKYPNRIDVSTPTGSKSVEWKTLCAQLGVAKAKTLLQSWEKTTNGKKGKVDARRTGLGVFVHSNTYGCMDYWEVVDVTYRGSLVKPSKGKGVEATWSIVKRALLYKLF